MGQAESLRICRQNSACDLDCVRRRPWHNCIYLSMVQSLQHGSSPCHFCSLYRDPCFHVSRQAVRLAVARCSATRSSTANTPSETNSMMTSNIFSTCTWHYSIRSAASPALSSHQPQPSPYIQPLDTRRPTACLLSLVSFSLLQDSEQLPSTKSSQQACRLMGSSQFPPRWLSGRASDAIRQS